MGTGRKIGKLMLAVARGADRVGDGMDAVFGENRTRPGDGFSKDRAGKRAGEFTRQARENNKEDGFIGKSGEKDEDREWF